MDKQREEFEAWLKDCNKHVYDVYKDGYSSSDNVENMCVEWAWQAWQQSQKVAAPEGFVVVPREIPKSFDEGLYFYSNSISVVNEYSEGFIPMSDIDHSEIWKLVIEAQEN